MPYLCYADFQVTRELKRLGYKHTVSQVAPLSSSTPHMAFSGAFFCHFTTTDVRSQYDWKLEYEYRTSFCSL